MLALAEGASLPQRAFLSNFGGKGNANEFLCSGYFHSVIMMSSSEVRNITVLGYHLSFFLLQTFVLYFHENWNHTAKEMHTPCFSLK
jgi:hypothetical protein